MQTSICRCPHGLTMLHVHPTTAAGSNRWCTDTAVMYGNTISTAHILSSLRLCRACTQRMVITESTFKGSQISIRENGTDTLCYMEWFGVPTLSSELCLIEPDTEAFSAHT